MAIDNTIKKKVIEDWQLAFPQLTKFAQNKLYKVVGPLVTGLELIRLPRTEEYRPHFVTYPLWEKDIKSCLNYPFMLQEFHNEKNLQYNIDYDNKDKVLFDNVTRNIWFQAPLIFEGDLSLETVLKSMDQYSESAPLLSNKQSCMYGLFLEIKMKIALYIDHAIAEPILNKIVSQTWNENNFKAFDINLDLWLKKLQIELNERDVLIKQINQNKVDKKISKLPSSELIP